MKPIAEMSQIELAAYICTHLKSAGISVVLSGGAAVSYRCNNRYHSADIDLVNQYSKERKLIIRCMAEIGFLEQGRYFVNNESSWFVEFPPGPVTVGIEPVKEIEQITFTTGTLQVLSATDSVKDRLAAYFHWGDLQCLQQAAWIAEENPVDMDELARWSSGEGKSREYGVFVEKLRKGL